MSKFSITFCFDVLESEFHIYFYGEITEHGQKCNFGQKCGKMF